jgi:hypothetical protein
MSSSEPVDPRLGWSGGAEPAREPADQDSSGGGRGAGLAVTTLVGAILIVVPLIWAAYYLATAGTAGLGTGLVLLVAVVLVACVATGVLLVRGLLKT